MEIFRIAIVGYEYFEDEIITGLKMFVSLRRRLKIMHGLFKDAFQVLNPFNY